MGISQLKFTDNEDGTMAIDAAHQGDFDPALMSHAALKAVTQFLPQILAPDGTIVRGDLGIRSLVTDADRYQALRALALLSEEQRDQIEQAVGSEGFPDSLAGFDELTDKIVALCRGANGPQTQAANDDAPPTGGQESEADSEPAM